MYVIATAGHVDHGKSTLVRRLTGMEPDRWAEERHRGLTIDLGFAWATVGDGHRIAFVDVPGHERFVPNMLAGIGPAPAALVARMPPPDGAANVRLWVDRAFTIGGAGTVITGTLQGGTLRVGEELVLASTGQRVHVRGLQSLGEHATSVRAVARVAVNLRGVDRHKVRRGDALLAPEAWPVTDTVDVALGPCEAPADELPTRPMLHIGSAAVPVRMRPPDAEAARLALRRPLPLRVGDRMLLRDPGQHRIVAGP